MNSITNKKLRRYRGSLVSNGKGIIYFGAWSVIKSILSIMRNPESILSNSTDYPTWVAILSTLLLFFSVSFIAFAVNLYIGRASCKEGLNGKKGSFYLVVAGVVAMIDIGFLLIYLVTGLSGGEDFDLALAAFLVDLTKSVLLIDIIYTAIMSRRMEKKLRSAAAEQ